MNRQALFRAILSTYEDERLSSSELKALRAIVADANLSDSARGALRHSLFEHVASLMSVASNRELVHWLEQVTGVVEGSGERLVQKRARAWFGPNDPMVQTLVGFIRATRRSLDVAVFTITDDRLRDALLEAHERGVAIRVLTDDDKAQDTGSDVRFLRRAGLPLRTDRSRYHFHHKFAVFDDAFLVNGSYNWTRGADRNNRENFLKTEDKTLVLSYKNAFEAMWNELE